MSAKKSYLISFILLFSIVASSCKNSRQDTAIIARIDGSPIYLSELQTFLLLYPEKFRNQLTSLPGQKLLLQRFINTKVLVAAAATKGIYPQPTTSQLDKFLEERRVVIQLQRYLADGELKVSEAEIREYYQQHLDLIEKTGVIFAHDILIRSPAEGQMILELLKTRTFEEVARQFSADRKTADKGGDISPFIPVGTSDPLFEQALVRAEVGKLSGVVRTRSGYHIFIKDAQKKGPAPLAFVRQNILQRLETDKFVAWLKRLISTKKIEIDPQFLKTPALH